MPGDDPATTTGAAKRTAALLRDARAVLRRLDTLLAVAQGDDDPSVPDITETRTAAERLVTQLARQEAGQRRRAAEAVRRAARAGRR
jgi:hypothetical protein